MEIKWVNVGTNSATYQNAALVNNDVVTVAMTSSLTRVRSTDNQFQCNNHDGNYACDTFGNYSGEAQQLFVRGLTLHLQQLRLMEALHPTNGS
jgi:hypothetical protein